MKQLQPRCARRRTAPPWCVTMVLGSVRPALRGMMLPGLFSHLSWDVLDIRWAKFSLKQRETKPYRFGPSMSLCPWIFIDCCSLPRNYVTLLEMYLWWLMSRDKCPFHIHCWQITWWETFFFINRFCLNVTTVVSIRNIYELFDVFHSYAMERNYSKKSSCSFSKNLMWNESKRCYPM